MTQLSYACTLFLSLLVTSLPFLLLGIFLSSWLLVFVDKHQLVTKFPRGPILGAIVGSSLGMIFPVCQYGNVPVARRLLIKGVSLSVSMGFLVASSNVNPIVIWFTWQAFPGSGSLVLYRLLFGWITGIIIALIFSTYSEKLVPLATELTPIETRAGVLASGTFLLPNQDSDPLHRVGNLVYEYKTVTTVNQPLIFALRLFWENAVRETWELGGVLVAGCALAAVIQVFLPIAQILEWGQTPVRQILVMMLLGSVLSLGSAVNGFFLSGLTSSFLKGSLLSFLLLGSVIDIKSLGLMFSTFRPKLMIYLVILVSELTFFWALVLNFSTG